MQLWDSAEQHMSYIIMYILMSYKKVQIQGLARAPLLVSELFGAPKAPLYCFQKYVFVWLHVRIYLSVKMAAPWGSLTLLSYYSLCPHLRSH